MVLRWETDSSWAHAGIYDGNRVWFLTFVHLPRSDVEAVARRAEQAGWTAVHVQGGSDAPLARVAEHEAWRELWIRREGPGVEIADADRPACVVIT